ncbi:calcium-binding protein [Dongia sedimenti]|uniref:Calcium-binding protein n=1 Tax=Dongia sedimenti TaxID=3064282 RepID=A0ABU0YUY7_9PROT|nr:calcium-binding protein [Rhodospirillaceae bacterium R-7]
MAQVTKTTAILDPSLMAADQSIVFFPLYDTYKHGTAGNDVMNGDAQRNALYGENGNDTLNGLGGNDYLSGGSGNDTLNGGSGNDILLGGAGADKMDGGSGNHDLVSYSGAATGVGVHLDTGTGNGGDANGDTYQNVEDITGSAYNDYLEGDSAIGGNVIHGGAGNDSIHGNGGYDTLYGDDGNDSITAFGVWNTSGSTIYGGAGNDRMTGGEGSDHIYGGSGNDTLNGREGVNTLQGDAGSDTFEFQKNLDTAGPAQNFNTIVDFNKNEDVLSLYDVFQGSGDNTDVFVGADANGDVQLTFGETTVVLEGVHNAGWNSVQALTNAGFDVQDTQF